MKLLSLECSTPNASAALIDDGIVIGSISWHEDRARHEGIFEKVQMLMTGAGWTFEDIEQYSVGRGPGAYSGLRVSLLAAQALAAPDGKPVFAVSSMEAMALDICQLYGLEDITIVGDARRHALWMGHCRMESLVRHPTEWSVVSLDDFAASTKPDSRMATPHWDALRELRERNPGVNWMADAQLPTAEQVARLVNLRLSAGLPTDPLTPLYLHPAV